MHWKSPGKRYVTCNFPKSVWPFGPLAGAHCGIRRFSSCTLMWLYCTWSSTCVYKSDYAPKLPKKCCVYFCILKFLLKCMKEGFNKFLLIWTKFHSVDTETRGYSLYGEIYDSLATILLPVTSLTMCRWHLSLESLTDRIMIFRPSLWIREVISVNVVTWNLRGENLRWLRNFSMLGKVMKLLNWKWLHLSL